MRRQTWITVVMACAVALCGWAWSASVVAEGRRIALVIGNGNYQHPENLTKLPNPPNDAEDIAAALRGFGFEVIERKNLSLEAMNRSVAEFGSRLGGSEAALFYFAGHGIQVRGQNYLMPVDAKIDSEAAVPYQGVDVNRILDEMENGRSNANIVMLDACRNNPITGKFRSGRSRGLASPGAVPRGTVIVYATDPGNVAADGEGRNGLFTAGLLSAFKGKDLSLDDVLTVASAEVERTSGQSQTPYVNGPKTLQKNFYFRVTVDPGRGDIEKTFWSSIESEKAAKEMHTGKVFKDCADCPEMVVIPAGSFEMGSNSRDSDERPVHTVRIGKPFAVAKTEVTQRQWRDVMGNNPSQFLNCGDGCPVEQVSWNDAREYVLKLSQKTGKTYRLPSEAEWEYACRAGGTQHYCGSDSVDAVAWYGAYTYPVGSSEKTTNPVARKQPNAWGLYDMSGNVWEWTEDCWNGSYRGGPSDGSAWASGDCTKHALRGGSWSSLSQNASSTGRDGYGATGRDSGYGFRPARMLP